MIRTFILPSWLLPLWPNRLTPRDRTPWIVRDTVESERDHGGLFPPRSSYHPFPSACLSWVVILSPHSWPAQREATSGTRSGRTRSTKGREEWPTVVTSGAHSQEEKRTGLWWLLSFPRVSFASLVLCSYLTSRSVDNNHHIPRSSCRYDRSPCPPPILPLHPFPHALRVGRSPRERVEWG